MALPRLTTALEKISSLPTLIKGQATTLKAAFDHDVNIVKDYINDVLIPGIESQYTAKSGDFTGTWNGKTMVETSPGIQAIVNAHDADFGDAYSSSSTYAVGNYSIYQNVLYKCTTAITTPEAWNASHWSQTTVAAELLLKFDKSKITRTAETNDQNYVPSSEVTYILQAQINTTNTNLSSVTKYFGTNLPYSNSLSTVASIISAVGNNGIIYSELNNAINPDTTHYFIININSYGAVTMLTAQGSDRSFYTATYINATFSGWLAK